MVKLVRCVAPSFLLAAVLLTPFFGKAFTIDDTLFLRQAEHLLTDPWHPTAFDIVWSEKPAPLRMSEIMVSGPTMAYLLLPTALAGGAEWVAHLTQLLLLFVALIATSSLALRCGLDARAACVSALLLAATPAALALASAAMPDIAAMTFAILGFERLAAWRDTNRWPAAVAASLALAVGALARSHVLLLLPIGALMLSSHALGGKREKQPRGRLWMPLFAVPVLVAIVSFVVRDPAGPPTVAAATMRYSGSEFVVANTIAFLVHWSLVLPVALPWALVHWRTLFRRPLLYLATSSVLLVLWGQQPLPRLALIAVAAGFGAAVLAAILAEAWRRRDSLQFALGLALFAPLPVGLYQHFPSKYLLVAAPAAAILVARMLSRQARPIATLATSVTVVAGVLLGVAIIRTDAAFADLGRQAAREWIAPQTARGQTVWFAGHWGFQWYAEKAGARCLTLRGPAPRPGDLAVSSRVAIGGIIEWFNPRTLVSVIEDDRPGGRIMSKADGAGFYSNHWGFLPWVWGNDVLDRYTLWRIDAAGVGLR